MASPFPLLSGLVNEPSDLTLLSDLTKVGANPISLGGSMSTTDAAEVSTTSQSTASEDNRWVARFEELLKVKNLEDLKGELAKLASEIQAEIAKFDLNAHLSPEAKTRLKTLETRYSFVIRSVQKAQKQFDREFNKSLRVLKRTRQDAEKHLKNIKAKITQHRSTIVKASTQLKKKIQSKTKTAKKGSSTAKKTARKATKAQ